MRNCNFIGAVVLVIACAGGPSADAQIYPTRPITMVVPFAAGGPTDTITRIVAERMRSPLGQTVIIENVTGADGVLVMGNVGDARYRGPPGTGTQGRRLNAASCGAPSTPGKQTPVESRRRQ